MVFLTLVIILTFVVPAVRWINKNGYDIKLVIALLLPILLTPFSFFTNLIGSLTSVIDTSFPTKDPNIPNYVAVIIGTYAAFFTFTVLTYVLLYAGWYLYWEIYRKEPRNKRQRRKKKQEAAIQRKKSKRKKRRRK